MTFNATEKYQSQIPALQLLVALGFTPLSQEDALRERGGRLHNVLLRNVLADQLLKLNKYTFRGVEHAFDLDDADEAINRLVPQLDRPRGLQATSQEVYDALLLGTTIAKTLDGDTKSHSFRYVDWQVPSNNTYHVTAELSVERTGTTSTNRCDIVAFVNGIPFIVIENKRPTESVKKAGSQLIRYQDADNIPHLFHYTSLLLAMNRQEARYATAGTPHKFWHTWREEGRPDDIIAAAANRPLTDSEKVALFSGDLAPAQQYFDQLAKDGPRAVSEQDRLIHALCRPERLLDLVRRFTVFDGGIRKIARHQQYFAVRDTVDRVATTNNADGRRKGGVIWHTQGSGKSLTMVMLGKALALDPRIQNPRILIVTDRDDLDKQIAGTFRACELQPVRASSGRHLADLIRAGTPLVTTIINKFENAARRGESDSSSDIFVLIDESHRGQAGRYGGHGQFAVTMRKLLPNACYLGFTGTPLLKGEKNTVRAFDGLIHKYTIDEAVKDGAVVPLLYEGRFVEQQIADTVIDRWFDKISEGLTIDQKRDLKQKFSRADVLNKTSQSIRAKAYDISEHYRKNWQGTGFKAQLVAPSKAAAIRFKEVLDDIGHVSSEIVISAPTDDEGNEEIDSESRDLVRRFWDRMMSRFGGESAYNKHIIDAFLSDGDPEILIVVSKLLTGFDAPRNTVLYICKSLREHTLLQAIARVNRVFESDGKDKEFGFVVDYEGLLGELDKALTAYSAFDGYDAEDLLGAVHDVREHIRLLPQRWSDVWELFKTLPNKQDMESFEQHLADDDVREEFYARLSIFGRCLHISLSSDKVNEVVNQSQLDRFSGDWKQFSQLRRAVQVRYQEVVSLHDYEPKIQRLLDDHVTAMPAEVIIEILNINDKDALQTVVDDTSVSDASKADRIASATKRSITERMDEDPALFRRFSEMLLDTISEYRQRRISEREYLQRIVEIAGKVGNRDRERTLPEALRHDDDAAALYGVLDGLLVHTSQDQGKRDDELAGIATEIVAIIRKHLIVGIWSNRVAQNELLNALDDYFWEELDGTRPVHLPDDHIDELQQKIMTVARARFPR